MGAPAAVADGGATRQSTGAAGRSRRDRRHDLAVDLESWKCPRLAARTQGSVVCAARDCSTVASICASTAGFGPAAVGTSRGHGSLFQTLYAPIGSRVHLMVQA